MPKYRVGFQLVAKGHFIIEADSEDEAANKVEVMDESELFNESCVGFDRTEVTSCEEME